MKKISIILLVLIFISCGTSSDDSETTITILETSDETTTSVQNSEALVEDDSENINTVIGYEFDVDKMSPFTGLELPAETWLKDLEELLLLKLIITLMLVHSQDYKKLMRYMKY